MAVSPEPEGQVTRASFPPEAGSSKRKGRYGTQNLWVTAAQVLAWAALLTALDRALDPALDAAGGAPWVRGLAAAALALTLAAVLQGVFSMMHEFFHDNAHPDRRVGYLIGLVGSTIFGTSATLHRVNHWGHHVRNRTPAEQGEFIHEGESAPGKIALYYFAVSCGLWLSGLVFPLAALLVPYRAVTWLSRHRRLNTYSAAFDQFDAAAWRRMRLEALGLLGFWGLVLTAGPWRVETLAVAYGTFAFTWSSLQWVYHLRTPLHVVEGAYNLRLPTPLRWAFLNFNYNLTHHRRPYLPWQELPAATELRETQPLWYRWVRMVRPPVRFPGDLAELEKRYF